MLHPRRCTRAFLGPIIAFFLGLLVGPGAGNAGEDHWYVYQDAGAVGTNHGVWAIQPENGASMVVIEEANAEQPYSGATSLKVAVRFEHPWWCSIVVTSGTDAWGRRPKTPAFDLAGQSNWCFTPVAARVEKRSR